MSYNIDKLTNNVNIKRNISRVIEIARLKNTIETMQLTIDGLKENNKLMKQEIKKYLTELEELSKYKNENNWTTGYDRYKRKSKNKIVFKGNIDEVEDKIKNFR